MKKIILYLFVMALAVDMAFAQPLFSRGYENRSYTVDQFVNGTCAGDFDDLLTAWVLEGKKQMKQVVLFDRHLEPHNVITLPHSEEMTVLAASVVERSRIGVLLADRSQKRSTMVLACEVNIEAQAVSPYDTVVKMDYDRKDVCVVKGDASPDGHRLGVVAVVFLADGKGQNTYAAMFDNRVKKLWEKTVFLGTPQDILVTDEGRMVTFGYESVSQEETKIRFNVLDEERASNFESLVNCDPIKEMHMANVIGDYAVALGTYQPVGRRNAEKLTAGVVGISFRFSEGKVSGLTMRPFQNEDVDIFLNMKTKKIQKELSCERIAVQSYAPVSYGGVITMGRMQRVETTKTGSAPVVQTQQMGLHVVAVDTTGHVRWARNLRRFDTQKKGDEPMLMGLLESDGKLCLIRTENAKEPAIYDIAKPSKQFVIGSKGNMALYTIDPQGEVEKFILEKKAKHGVLRADKRQDGKVIILAANGKYTRAAEMLFRH